MALSTLIALLAAGMVFGAETVAKPKQDTPQWQAFQNAFRNWDFAQIQRNAPTAAARTDGGPPACAHILQLLPESPGLDMHMAIPLPEPRPRMPVLKGMPVCPEDRVNSPRSPAAR